MNRKEFFESGIITSDRNAQFLNMSQMAVEFRVERGSGKPEESIIRPHEACM